MNENAEIGTSWASSPLHPTKGANCGALLDGHLEFPGGRTGIATVKKNNIFRVG